MTRLSWLITALLLVAAGVRAQPACTDALDLTVDGAIARWDVCRGGAPQAFAASGERRLGLGVSAEGKPIDMAWRRAEPAPGEWRFRAVDSAHSLEVERAYRRVDANVLEHTLTVTNTSGPALRDVVLTLDPGSALPPDHPATGALADFFYGFQRMLVANDSGEWRSAELDREVGAFARVARHKTLIVDAAEKLAVVHAVGAIARRDSGTQDADPDDASGRLLLALTMPKIEAGETVVFRQKISALPTDTRALAAAGYEGLTYAHLAAPIAWLSAGVERVLSRLAQIAGPGLAVILLAVGVRVVTLPVSLWSARRQSEFSAIAAGMKPKIASVRARYKGAEQSERILGIYKENGVSPFSGLKGSAALFVQIPFLLAVFNVTTMSSSLYAEPFLWIEDLSLPDAAAPLPASILLLGSHLNALPLAMGMVFLLAPPAGSEHRAGLGMGAALVTLLMVMLVYSFAAALLLYWLAANTFQAGERFVFRRASLVGGSP